MRSNGRDRNDPKYYIAVVDVWPPGERKFWGPPPNIFAKPRWAAAAGCGLGKKKIQIVMVIQNKQLYQKVEPKSFGGGFLGIQ